MKLKHARIRMLPRSCRCLAVRDVFIELTLIGIFIIGVFINRFVVGFETTPTANVDYLHVKQMFDLTVGFVASDGKCQLCFACLERSSWICIDAAKVLHLSDDSGKRL